MNPASDIISKAKTAMTRGDYASALAVFRTLDLAALDAMTAIRALIQMSLCAHALGRGSECAAFQREGLAIYTASGFMAAPDLDIAKLGLMLAIGAGDVRAAASLLPALFPDLAAAPRSFRISPVVPLVQWCGNRGIDVAAIDPPGDGPPTWRSVIPAAEIVAGWDFVIAPTGEVLEGANHFPLDAAIPYIPHVLNRSLNLVAHVWPDACTPVDEDALFLVSSEKHHYGHWIADFLPRLRAWGGRRKLAVAASLPGKHRDLLAGFGVTRAHLIECEIGRRYRFRTLEVVRTAGAARPSRAETRFLYQAFAPKPGPKGARKLFLVRESGTRLPANQDELDAVLREFGVEKVNPARLSYAEQRALLADTGLIIGVFGTELYCLLNMRPGTAVIELIWDAGHATVYGPMCGFLGLDHRLVLCTRAPERGHARYKLDGDIIVDCGELRRQLGAILRR